MDPLGARPSEIDVGSVRRWADTCPPSPPLGPAPDSEAAKSLPNVHAISPFRVREDLNAKVALWVGDITMLCVEAVVNPTNESLTDKNPISARLFELAGPELREECKAQIVSCRTGEARITGGYQLPARYVIHTVGPRYNLRYRTAAESALYNCYRSVMQIVRSRHLASVAFSVVNSSRRGYPALEGANIAIRTIRRFLEHYGDEIELVVFVSDMDESIYDKIMPHYFPRSRAEEEFAAKAMPPDIGNEFGEPVIEERQIRIADNPVSKSAVVDAIAGRSDSFVEDDATVEKEEEAEEDEGLIDRVGSHAFAAMTSDHDQERRDLVRSKPPTEQETQKKRYQSYLRRARTENFSDIAGLGAFYKAGVDYVGRHVIVYIGRQFPAPKVDLSKAIAYFVHVMDPIVSREQEYVIVYFHTLSLSENQPDSSFFKDLYAMLDARYKRLLRAFYYVHPTWWSKVSAWWFLTFTAAEVKDNFFYITGVQHLFDTINPDQIDIPQFVFDHDIELNGKNYYTPATKGDEASGGL